MQSIVDDAVAEADVLGSVILGQLEVPLNRARTAPGSPGSTRGAESTLGIAVANIQLWATQDNGAQIRQVLEERWQPAGSSRPFLRLGTSTEFAYTYGPNAVAGSRILDMRLDGDPIADDDVVKVVVNSFLAAGGDNFTTLAEGVNKADSGRVDLTAQVDYLDANGILDADDAQHAVGITGLDGFTFTQGADVTFDISSLMMTGPTDLLDQNVTVALGKKVVGTFPVVNVRPSDLFDEHGTASVVTLDVTVPKKEKANNGNGKGDAFAFSHDKQHVIAPHLCLAGSPGNPLHL